MTPEQKALLLPDELAPLELAEKPALRTWGAEGLEANFEFSAAARTAVPLLAERLVEARMGRTVEIEASRKSTGRLGKCPCGDTVMGSMKFCPNCGGKVRWT